MSKDDSKLATELAAALEQRLERHVRQNKNQIHRIKVEAEDWDIPFEAPILPQRFMQRQQYFTGDA